MMAGGGGHGPSGVREAWRGRCACPCLLSDGRGLSLPASPIKWAHLLLGLRPGVGSDSPLPSLPLLLAGGQSGGSSARVRPGPRLQTAGCVCREPRQVHSEVCR